MNRYWFFYILGIVLPLFFKYAHYMLRLDPVSPEGVPTGFWRETLLFLFRDTRAAIKSLFNFSGEWLIGAMYVDRLPVAFGDVFQLPLHIALSFFLGVIAETFIVPPLIGFFVSKFGPPAELP